MNAYASAYASNPTTEGSFLESPYTTSLRDVRDRAEQAKVLVAEVQGRVVGTITYVPDESNPYAEFRDPDAAGIRMLAVADGSRRSGIARQLVQECSHLARAQSKTRIILHTTPWMSAAANLYESLGFVRSPERDMRVSRDTSTAHTPGIHLRAYELILVRDNASESLGRQLINDASHHQHDVGHAEG